MKQTSAGKKSTTHVGKIIEDSIPVSSKSFFRHLKWISGIYNMPENPIASFITPLSRFTRYQPTVPSNGQAIRA